MKQAVFLDRDNTLIANDGDLGDPTALRLLDGVPESLLRLRESGFCLFVVTNQGGVARGKYQEADVVRVHEALSEMLNDLTGCHDLIEAFFYCPFHPEGVVEEYCKEHPWRKPQPGMLLHAALKHDLDLARSWMIGDQPRDVQAGRAAGCTTIQLGGSSSCADFISQTLLEATEIVLKETAS